MCIFVTRVGVFKQRKSWGISFLLFSPVFSLHLCSSPFASPLPYPLCSSLSNSSRTAVQRARHSTESTVNVQNNELDMYFRINVLGCEIHWKRVCIWHVKIFLREHGVTAKRNLGHTAKNSSVAGWVHIRI